nr:unnamed protein product [Callosobruchus analis]
MYYLFYIYWISKDITLGYPYIIEPLVSTVLIGLVLFSITTLGCCGVIEEVICCISMVSSTLGDKNIRETLTILVRFQERMIDGKVRIKFLMQQAICRHLKLIK